MIIGVGLDHARIDRVRDLLERYPELVLEGEPSWGTNPFFRGFDQLTVRSQ